VRLIWSIVFIAAAALGETPSPSTHWGALAFPDAFSALEAAISFDRFTPADGLGVQYNSIITDALGFNILSLSWAHRWRDLWMTSVTMSVSATHNQPTQFMQEALHSTLSFPTLPTFNGRTAVDFMVDGSVTKWFSPLQSINLFTGAGFSAGTIYNELFVRAGVRRVPLTPSWHDSDWGSMSFRGSFLARVSLQGDSLVLTKTARLGRIFQPSLSFGQYKLSVDGQSIPTWEGEFALTWDSGIFANAQGVAHYGFFWSAAVVMGSFRVETWNDSIGTSFISPFTDYGPTFGIAFGVDVLALGFWS